MLVWLPKGEVFSSQPVRVVVGLVCRNSIGYASLPPVRFKEGGSESVPFFHGIRVMNHSIYHIEALILETGEGGEYNYKTDVPNDGSEDRVQKCYGTKLQ